MLDKLKLRADGRRLITYGASPTADMVLEDAELRMLAAVRRAPSAHLVFAARRLVVLRLEPEPGDTP